MYENDYSWVPAFFAGWMAIASVGGLALSFIRPDRMRARVFWAWLSVPVLVSIGLGVFAALYAENLESYSPLLFVPMLGVILAPPWLIAACSLFSFSRYFRGVHLKPKG